MNDEELIRGYYNQLLSAEQGKEYRTRYEANKEFRALAEQMEIEILGIREAGREEIKSKFSNWDNQDETSNDQRFSVFGYVKMGIAAILVIGIGLYFYNPTEKDDLFLAYYESYQNYEHTPTRDDEKNNPSLKDLAYKSYDQENYAAAESYFSRLIESDSRYIPAFFFRGMSRLELKSYQTAMSDFERASQTQDVYYQDASIWYLALINIKLGNRDLSRSLLKKLHSKKGQYQQQALELSNKL